MLPTVLFPTHEPLAWAGLELVKEENGEVRIWRGVCASGFNLLTDLKGGRHEKRLFFYFLKQSLDHTKHAKHFQISPNSCFFKTLT